MKKRKLLESLLFMFFVFSSLNADVVNPQFHSQCGQDKYLYTNFFKDKPNGVFVDVGAHDGVSLSNTFFFEKGMTWTGICVEPIPDVFALLKANRNCTCIQACICDKYESVPFLRIKGTP